MTRNKGKTVFCVFLFIVCILKMVPPFVSAHLAMV